MYNLYDNFKNKIFSSLGIFFIGILVLFDFASASDQNWKFSSLYGRGTAFGALYQQLADDIKSRTNNSVKGASFIFR